MARQDHHLTKFYLFRAHFFPLKVFFLLLFFTSAYRTMAQDLGEKHEKAADSVAVVHTLKQFLHIINHLELEAFLSFFTDDATVFHPRRSSPYRSQGLDKIAAVFGVLFDSLRKGKSVPPYLNIQPCDLHIQMLKGAAVVSFHITEPKGAEIGRRTLVLQKQKDKWAIVHIHASLIKVAE